MLGVKSESVIGINYNHGFVRLDQVKTNVLFSVILLRPLALQITLRKGYSFFCFAIHFFKIIMIL